MSKALVLLSGGLDSAVVAAIAAKERSEVMVLSFDYMQRHSLELFFGEQLAQHMDVDRLVLTIPQSNEWGKSALTDLEQKVPTHAEAEIGKGPLPATMVPARNLLFLSYAFGVAATYKCSTIYTGFNAVDYSGYPDCRPAFVEAMRKVFDTLAEMHQVEIRTPIIESSKADVVRWGNQLGVPFGKTWSCYDPQYGYKDAEGNMAVMPCGVCDSCKIRHTAFMTNCIEDPVRSNPTYLPAEFVKQYINMF